ncbi:MAG: peptidylprolyl isomerase [Cyclobacteriaceae bacterium]|nr:peptidylprolyl isomerase [Cyclobacteriaceae bacterium]
MLTRRILLISIVLISGCTVFNSTQKESSDSLFSIDGEPHYSDEFIYAFSKNNQTDNVTQDSIDNYLDLYVKFRLKVKAAKDLGYDTTASFKKEFAQYKDQLQASYLSPKKEQEALIKQAYERSLWEVKASHILIELKPNATPEDTLAAYNKIASIRSKAISGESFEKLARQFSEDPSAKQNGGELGYFSALQMVYPFENAAFETPVGQISEPVRTRFGYHIVKVEDKRKNEGKIEVAHIMVRSTPKDSEDLKKAAKAKIEKIDSLLRSSDDWNKTCKAYSEDKNSVYNNGMLRPFSRGQIVPEFETTAFNLKNPGDISEPVQTQFGWHIIKLIKKIPVGSFAEERDDLARKVSRDSRSSLPEDEMLKKLKAENHFEQNEMVIQNITTPNANTHLNFPDTTWLFSIGGQQVPIAVFKKRYNVKSTPEKIKQSILSFGDSLVIAYEKEHLEEKYPEYKYLVNEYYDGILLFSIMEDSVWNKAMTDSLGLKRFYDSHKSNYLANMMDTTIFYSNQESTIDAVIERDSENSADWETLKSNLLEEYNISPLTLRVVSRDNAMWNRTISTLTSRNINPIEVYGNWYWVRIREELKPQPLNNVKGKVITEYQNELDDQWVMNLKARYPVEVNKKKLKKVYEHFKATK